MKEPALSTFSKCSHCQLTGNVSVAIFQRMEVRHELPDWDLKNFKQTGVLEKCVSHLRKEKCFTFTPITNTDVWQKLNNSTHEKMYDHWSHLSLVSFLALL